MTGDQLEQARQMMGFSRQELASKLGLTYSAIFSWESNGSAHEELKSWVPLALAGLNPDSFKIIDGEIFIRLQSNPLKDTTAPQPHPEAHVQN